MMLVAGGIMNSHQRDADRLKAEGEKPFALPFTGLRVPHGVAVDAAGNVYVSDSHTQRVLKLSAGSNTQTVLPFTGLDLCSNNIEATTGGVAVDAAGSVYVADSCNNRVVKLAAGSSTQTVLPFRGLDFPQGVAVDSAGAAYALDHSGGRILKVAAGASAQTVLPKSGLAGPTGDVAVDTTGNVYASCRRGRSARSCLLRLAPGSDSWVRLPSAPDHSADTFSSGEQTVAVDAAGNVYMIATRAVLKLAPGSETWTALPGAPSLVDPLGLAADTRGNVYVTDHVGSRATGSGLPWEKDDAVGFVLRLPAG
jgi:sugar lactone lactonase YvrE